MSEQIKKLTRKEKIAQGIEKAPKRKTQYAQNLKDARQDITRAILRNFPTSPRKMRLVIDVIRGMSVGHALNVLKHTHRVGAEPVRKLLLSAIANWEDKNDGARADEENLIVKEAHVDSGRMLKRFRPAPQGRAHRIRKRSNHVTLVLANREEE